MDDKTQEDIQEAVIVEEAEIVEEVDSNESSDAIVITNLQNLINETLNRIYTIGEEVKPLDEMINSVLENDEVYRNHTEAAKEASKVKNATKAEIVKRPDVSNVYSKIKDKKSDLKEAKESLSEYLQEYSRLTGQRQFETPEGLVQEIVYSAKLVRRS